MPSYPAGVRFVDQFGRPTRPLLLEKVTEEEWRALGEQTRQLEADWDHRAKFEEYEVAEHLDDVERVAAYFTEAFAVGDYHGIAVALVHIARARGRPDLAEKIWADLTERYYVGFFDPSISAAGKVLDSIGLKLAVVPAGAAAEST